MNQPLPSHPLKRMRILAGLSQSALAERLGVSQPTVSAMERRDPDTVDVVRVAKALGADIALVVKPQEGDAMTWVVE